MKSEINKIKIDNPKQIGEKRIEYNYEISGEWKKVFHEKEKMYLEYNFDISDVPNSIKIIPLISNIIPVAWVYGAVVEIEEIDETFYNCLKEILKSYQKMYPKLKLIDKLKVRKVIKNEYEKNEKSAMLFSGGADSFSTLLEHKCENISLITVWGADISIEDEDGWEIVKNETKNVAEKYEIESYFIKSNFRSFLNHKQLNEKVIAEAGDDWWHGFQHGVGLLGQTSIIAYENKINKIYIASSIAEKYKGISCASNSAIDNNVKFCSCRVIHDQPNMTRQEKIDFIIKKCEEEKQKPILRVCWQKHSKGKNCCRCEKCYRTIYEIVLAGGNPNEYGFIYDKNTDKRIRYEMLYKIALSDGQMPDWKEIKEGFKEKKDIFEKEKRYQWIYKINFSEVNKNKWRKTRKWIGKQVRKMRRES